MHRNDATIYNDRGMIIWSSLNNNPNIELAITHFIKAIELKPDYVEAYHNCGSAYNWLNQYTDAIPYFDTAIKLDPNHVNSHSFTHHFF